MMYISKRTGALFITLFIIVLLIIYKLNGSKESTENHSSIRLKESTARQQSELPDVVEKNEESSTLHLPNQVEKASLGKEEHVVARRLWSRKNVAQLWEELSEPENVLIHF